MSLLVSWQLVLFLCATSFRDSLERAVPAENGRATGLQFRPLALGGAGEQSRRYVVPESVEGSRPALEALVRGEKGLSAFNWNSFGLRYGRRQVGGPPWASVGLTRAPGSRGQAVGRRLEFPS